MSANDTVAKLAVLSCDLARWIEKEADPEKKMALMGHRLAVMDAINALEYSRIAFEANWKQMRQLERAGRLQEAA